MGAAAAGGFWKRIGTDLILIPDGGCRICLKKNDLGFYGNGWKIFPCQAEIVGFWPNYDPSNIPYRTLLETRFKITSTWGGKDWADIVISGENSELTACEEGIRWNHGGKSGLSNWLIGTPFLDDPRAFHLPHFYDYWGRLGHLRPQKIKPQPGITWLSSYGAGRTSLTARRFTIAEGLARWFPVAVSNVLEGIMKPSNNITYHEVPWTLMGKYNFISQHQFNLCFENSIRKGYLTEKPFDAIISGCVPLYEGDPDVQDWIDSNSIIDCSGLCLEDIADRIRQAEIDGTCERVWENREKCFKIHLEEMNRRVNEFIDRASVTVKSRDERSFAISALVSDAVNANCRTQTDPLTELSIVIKTILRPEALAASITAFRKILGTDVEIIVVDDSPHPGTALQDDNLRYVNTEFDIGLSAGRNLGVSLVNTKYVLISDDDDILVSSKVEVTECIKLLDSLELVGNGAFDLLESPDGLVVSERTLQSPVERCDATLNFFVARTELLRNNPWDSKMKLHPEHEDFFLSLKRAGALVAGTTLLRYRTYESRPSAYNALRSRQYLDLFTRKWGFVWTTWKYGINEISFRPNGEVRKIRHVRICDQSEPIQGCLNIGSMIGPAWNCRCSISGKLPLPDESVELVSMDRVLERKEYSEGMVLLREIFRVLKPGGTLRVATYDFELIRRLASGNPTPEEESYIIWATDNFYSHAPGYDPSFVINFTMHSWGHIFLYDQTTLADALESTGFICVKDLKSRESDIAEFCNTEWSDRMPEGLYDLETLVVEASRPFS